MGKTLELTDQKFNRLYVIERLENNKRNQTQWLCQCDCGNIVKVEGFSLKSGHTKSCGCLQKEAAIKVGKIMQHGHNKNGKMTRIYKTWDSMRDRCNNPKHKAYKYYGGRGIMVCKRWDKFGNFLADMGERPEGLTIERKNNNKGYFPDNCIWATRKEQARNSHHTKLNHLKVQVIKKLLKESNLLQKDIAEIFDVAPMTICNIKAGKSWGDICYE